MKKSTFLQIKSKLYNRRNKTIPLEILGTVEKVRQLIEQVNAKRYHYSRPEINKALKEKFQRNGWEAPYGLPDDRLGREVDVFGNGIAMEIEFNPTSMDDLGKFKFLFDQGSIQCGILVVATHKFSNLIGAETDLIDVEDLLAGFVSPDFNVPVFVFAIETPTVDDALAIKRKEPKMDNSFQPRQRTFPERRGKRLQIGGQKIYPDNTLLPPQTETVKWIIQQVDVERCDYSPKKVTDALEDLFLGYGWKKEQPAKLSERRKGRVDFVGNRAAVEVQFGRPFPRDILKMQSLYKKETVDCAILVVIDRDLRRLIRAKTHWQRIENVLTEVSNVGQPGNSPLLVLIVGAEVPSQLSLPLPVPPSQTYLPFSQTPLLSGQLPLPFPSDQTPPNQLPLPLPSSQIPPNQLPLPFSSDQPPPNQLPLPLPAARNTTPLSQQNSPTHRQSRVLALLGMIVLIKGLLLRKLVSFHDALSHITTKILSKLADFCVTLLQITTNIISDFWKALYASWKGVFIILVVLVLLATSGIMLYSSYAQQATNDANATATTQANNNAATQFAAQATNQANTATAQANAQATAQANAQATATAIAYNPYPPHTGTLVINDPLSDDSRDYQWDVSPTCVFTNGAYQVSTSGTDLKSSLSTCTAEATNFTNNFVYQADVTIIHGNCGGITFLSQDNNRNYTYFEVCQDGSSYSTTCTSVNGITDCAYGAPRLAVHTGLGQRNTLAVVFRNNNVSLYMNQQFLQAYSTVGSGGKIGLLADFAPNQAPPGEVVCSNVKVWTL